MAEARHMAMRLVRSSYRVLRTPLYWLYEERLERQVERGAMPKHIGLIMDGNRRFARNLGIDIVSGHDSGAEKAREVINWCYKLGITHVTLWAFSTENKGRTAEEVRHLYDLFGRQAKLITQDPDIHKNRVNVRVIGDTTDFPEDVKRALAEMERATAGYSERQLNVAIGYGGREEIVSAVKRLLKRAATPETSTEALINSVSVDAIEQHLYTAGTPDPDFIIRTSGEVRLSGFLLWQAAYSEYYFCDAFWPSFRRVDFLRAIRSYQARERRFGR